MQLLNPIALLWLGLIPVLVLIHSLRPKAKQIEVTNLFLWIEALNEKTGGVRLDRLIRNLPLLLQILIVILASLALAQPVFFMSSQPRGNVILILDTSASMKARLDSGVRFDRAREEAVKAVDGLTRKSEMLIIEAGLRPVIRSDFTSDKGHLKQVIENIRPEDAPGRIQDAVFLALPFIKPEQDDLILLVTDGAGQDIGQTLALHPQIKPSLITGPERNVGITRFEVRPRPGYSDHFEIMLEVKNYNNHPVLCPVRLTLAQVPIVEETVGLRAMEKKRRFYSYSGDLSGTARAVINISDDFTVDNSSYAVLKPFDQAWVFLVTQGNYFLETLLKAYPNIRVNSAREIAGSLWADQAQRHDIVILDRVSPPSTIRGNFILIGASSPSLPISRTGEVRAPRVLDWDRNSPLMEHLDLSGLIVEKALEVKAGGAASPLLESPETGLIYSYQEDDLKAVFLGFELTGTDLPLRAAFPILMSNIFNWFHPEKFSFSAQTIQAGQVFPISLGAETKEFSVRTPSGEWEVLQADGRSFEYVRTGEVGLYTVLEGEERRYFAVNLTDEAESDIRSPNLEIQPGRASLAEPVRVETPLWLSALLAALAVLMVEWYFWLRNW